VENEGTRRKKYKFDVRNDTDIITVTYSLLGDAASNASNFFYCLIRL
jgi:hypothetical protein